MALALAASLAAEPELVDRIVAVVDEDPILLSEVEQVLALSLIEPREGESRERLERRALDALIEQRVRFHEIDRYGFAELPTEQVEMQLESIRASFDSDEEFAARLDDLGLDLRALRQLVARQLMVASYVEERLGARVFVGLDDIRAHYRDELVPALEAAGEPVPPLDEVREAIRVTLRERRLNEEIERWTEELRRAADILDYFDDAGEPLPPVVYRSGADR